MYKLSKALQSYTNLRLSQDPGWKDIKVWSYDLYFQTYVYGTDKIMQIGFFLFFNQWWIKL